MQNPNVETHLGLSQHGDRRNMTRVQSLVAVQNLFPNVVAVPEASARDGGEYFKIVEADHNSISKPASKFDRRFSALEDLLHHIARASEVKGCDPPSSGNLSYFHNHLIHPVILSCPLIMNLYLELTF